MNAQALKDSGCYIINDPRGKPTPAENIAEAPDQSAMLYGFSCHCCLPSGAFCRVTLVEVSTQPQITA